MGPDEVCEVCLRPECERSGQSMLDRVGSACPRLVRVIVALGVTEELSELSDAQLDAIYEVTRVQLSAHARSRARSRPDAFDSLMSVLEMVREKNDVGKR